MLPSTDVIFKAWKLKLCLGLFPLNHLIRVDRDANISPINHFRRQTSAKNNPHFFFLKGLSHTPSTSRWSARHAADDLVWAGFLSRDRSPPQNGEQVFHCDGHRAVDALARKPAEWLLSLRPTFAPAHVGPDCPALRAISVTWESGTETVSSFDAIGDNSESSP